MCARPAKCVPWRVAAEPDARARGAGLTVPSVTYSTLTMKGLGGVLLTPPTLVILCESDVLWGTLLVYNYI